MFRRASQIAFILTSGANSEALITRNCLENDVQTLDLFLSTYYKWFAMYCLKLLIHCFWIGGSLRGRGWKYGSGFVDGIFPVMSPTAEKIMDLVQEEVDKNRIWQVLGSLPASHAIWDDIINVAVQLRLNKQWDQIMWVRNKCLLITFVSFKCFSGKGCLMMMQLIKWNFHFGK